MVKTLFRSLIITLFRPLLQKEILGWGKIYNLVVGGYSRNWFWEGSKIRQARGKLNNALMELNLAEWKDRGTFFTGRWYDLPTQKLLDDVLKPGDEVIDIGANVGMFTLSARNLVGNTGSIHCFEPNPTVLAKLNRNIELNQFNNINVHSIGLSDIEDQFTLYVPHINAGEGTIGAFPESEYNKDECYEVLVDVKIGDNVLGKTSPRLIKLDVEGAEVNVLKGLNKLIDKCLPIIIAEYVPHHLSRFNHSFEDIQSIAQEHGYKIFHLGLVKESGNYNLSLTPIESKPEESCDILLCHVNDSYLHQIS